MKGYLGFLYTRQKIKCSKFVVPMQAGNHADRDITPRPTWIPAYAGKTTAFLSCAELGSIIFFILISYGNTIYSAKPSSLASGRQLFTQYCGACHTLRYHGHPKVSMPAAEAIRWFGVVPPDLSLIARVRGRAWLVAYLTGFYPDAHRPFGSNNIMFPDVQMPNVLALESENGQPKKNHQVVIDIVDYLVYVSDPYQAYRYRIGFRVIGFLIVFSLLLYGLYFLSDDE